MMLADGSAVRGLLERVEERPVDHALAERTPRVLPAGGFLLPGEVLDDDGRVIRLCQPRSGRPRQPAFDRGVADVKTEADVTRVERPDHRVNIPHRGTDILP